MFLHGRPLAAPVWQKITGGNAMLPPASGKTRRGASAHGANPPYYLRPKGGRQESRRPQPWLAAFATGFERQAEMALQWERAIPDFPRGGRGACAGTGRRRPGSVDTERVEPQHHGGLLRLDLLPVRAARRIRPAAHRSRRRDAGGAGVC